VTTEFAVQQLGHPVLRQEALAVEDIGSPSFQQKLDQLLNFVLEKGGMGIAAPQVGISERVFILSSHPNQRYPYAPDVAPFFVINPTIIEYSDTKEKIGKAV
jgi:peptide deformylase